MVAYNWLIKSCYSNPIASPSTTTTYTVTVTDDNGCQSASLITISANPLPIVDAGLDLTLCNSGGTILETLVGFSPTGNGGTWTGTDVSNAGVFTPNSVGVFTLTYTFIDNNACVNLDSIQVSVADPVLADAGFDFDTCIDAGLVDLVLL